MRAGIAACTGAALLLALNGCKASKDGEQHAGDAQAVQAMVVEAEPFAPASELAGRIEPVRVAEVRARVAGIVLHRKFHEGANVRAGDTLFVIDPAPFRAALSKAQGELARAEAVLAEAQAVVQRYGPLVKIDAVSKQDFDAALAAQKSASATRQSMAAEVETARLNLGYATVTAPISGRIGRALVTEGALVGQGEATPMAIIQQIDPVYADFKQPLADAMRLREAKASGADAALSITVDGTEQVRNGKMLFSDITVDRGTGQISLRGEFANSDGLLLPGMYVRVKVQQAEGVKAILLPQRAIRRTPDGNAQVFVINKDDVVEARQIKTGSMHGGRWHVIEGVEDGDCVVVDGNPHAGDKVVVKTDPKSDAISKASGIPESAPSGVGRD